MIKRSINKIAKMCDLLPQDLTRNLRNYDEYSQVANEMANMTPHESTEYLMNYIEVEECIKIRNQRKNQKKRGAGNNVRREPTKQVSRCTYTTKSNSVIFILLYM